tara:strand:+ start:25424 stop:25933 length:510 start_codon:yes stop_codon:yes gene_type:complete
MQIESTHPRYCPEHSLPEHAYQPGIDSASVRPPEREYDDGWNAEASTLCNSLGFRFGVDLFNNQFYWEAHEAWERLWLRARPESAARHVLQGLIQSAAAMLKAQGGQWHSFERLLPKASKKFTKAELSEDRGQLGWAPSPFLALVQQFGKRRGEALRPCIVLMLPAANR